MLEIILLLSSQSVFLLNLNLNSLPSSYTFYSSLREQNIEFFFLLTWVNKWRNYKNYKNGGIIRRCESLLHRSRSTRPYAQCISGMLDRPHRGTLDQHDLSVGYCGDVMTIEFDTVSEKQRLELSGQGQQSLFFLSMMNRSSPLLCYLLLI